MRLPARRIPRVLRRPGGHGAGAVAIGGHLRVRIVRGAQPRAERRVARGVEGGADGGHPAARARGGSSGAGEPAAGAGAGAEGGRPRDAGTEGGEGGEDARVVFADRAVVWTR